MRQYTGIDKLINSFDQALRSLVPGATSAPQRKSIHDPSPDKDVRASLGVNNSSCSEECAKDRL